MATRTYPYALTPVHGPFTADKIAGAADGMGSYGDATRELVARGFLQPDLICGMTLALISDQPSFTGPKPRKDGKVSGTDGGVWVRERFTIHRPLAIDDPWEVEGEATGTYVRKGRRYNTTISRSTSSGGHRFATNLSTGLNSYRPEPDLPDSEDGTPVADTPTPEPDRSAAAHNPHLDAVRGLSVGDRFGDVEVPVTLAMMAARDTKNPNNPIHSDPDAARKAGLRRPIAGGSHVLAFPLEAVMAGVGIEVLLHGSTTDVRWKAPTEDGAVIVPSAVVASTADDGVTFDLQVDLLDGPTAMVGTLCIPLPT